MNSSVNNTLNLSLQNRLLAMIRQQQLQLQQLQTQQSQSQLSDNAVIDATDRSDAATPGPPATASSVSANSSAPQSALPLPSGSLPRSPGFPHHPRSSFDLARADLHQRRSRTPSRGASPHLRATSIGGESGEQWVLGGRDESAFYQAETQMLVRENQMLKHRVRELGMFAPSPTTPSSQVSCSPGTDTCNRKAALRNPHGQPRHGS